MLKKLSIKNFAVIEALELKPEPGLNIFTGETGAGKSIIISALGFLLGERSGSDILRPGAPSAEVEGEFLTENLPSGLADRWGVKQGLVAIRRQADPKGRTRAAINGTSATLAQLSEIGGFLVDFHGQNEHQSLLKPETQRQLLDAYGKLEKETKAVEGAWAAAQALEESLNAVSMSEDERGRLLDLYRFQLAEIEAADLKEGEEEELEALWPRLKNSEKLFTLSGETHGLVDNAAGDTEKALEKIRALSAIDPSAERLTARLASASIELRDLSGELRSYGKGVHSNPSEVDRCLSRLEKFKILKKKYGADIPAVLARAGELRTKVASLDDLTLDRSELEKKLAAARGKLEKAAEALHDRRAAAAKKLSDEILKEAQGLGFKEVRFAVDASYDGSDIHSSGGDSVEYLFTANPGYPLRPLRYTASGGEMARIMLALKTALSRADRIGAQVFDEVDAGVGAVTGRLVGEKLARLAADKQIFCITHLAQVASFGEAHFFVEKAVKSGVSAAAVNRLDPAAREREIARMLGGKKQSSELGLKHARELLAESQK
ncbi:MAG: DNA repair protein RecN [Elusimicrobia bacterium CG_4_10_14_0_2_um_filter_56_8]|nr:MAG: DNA repair protein RecN [Elusimicrobia bacterium CG1_02_56_21]PJA13751.1 MAG: DNA repair protein RecN [Elusimicrobia bacterium CG_4_10_14_0_2_um_filter_56_8]